jgi:hypothetical protein
VEYLDGAGVKWARKVGLNWSVKGWNIWMSQESNGLQFLIGAGV